MTVHVLFKFATNPYKCPAIDTTSGGGQFRELSPFVLGPCRTYVPDILSRNFENLWQFSKVYIEHVASDGFPSIEWYAWSTSGWRNERAIRYPMGKGRKPEYTWWNSEKLGYIEARKQVYARLYAENARVTESYKALEHLYHTRGEIVLRDYDAYNFRDMGMSYRDVINNPNRTMGHAFVLAMMLEGVLEECLES